MGALATGLLAATISIAVGTGGPEKITITGGEQVQQLIAGIAQDGPYLGPPDASVTIGVFTDLQCSTCDSYELDTVDPLIEEYARAGEARLEFHNYSLGEAETTTAAYAATAAGDQDREWQYVDMFFRNQHAAPNGTITDEFLADIGNAIPDFDLDAWKQAMDSPEVKDRVDADGNLAAQYGLRVNGPSVIVDGPGGTKVLQDSPTKEQVDAAVSAVGGA